jgi:tetratricopeptide (TPR) repeat protein
MLRNNINFNVKNFFIAVYLFLISFFVYVMTLCPTVYVGDSGELITAAFTLGIAHPPGYPLYCLLGKIFTFIPVSNIAFRLNLMSAFFASASISLLYYLVISVCQQNKKEDTVNLKLACIAGFLIFAFTNSLWSQAVIAEVYTLNLFLVLLLFLVAFKYFYSKRRAFLYTFAFLAGLAPTNHQMVLIFYPLFLIWFLLTDTSILKKPKLMLYCVLLFLLGLSIYFYLPFRSLSNPAIDWGNPETLRNFFNHIMRRQYGSLLTKNPHTLNRFIAQLNIYSMYLKEQFNYLFLGLGFMGIIYLYKNRKKFLFVTLYSFLISSWGSLFVINFPADIGFFYTQGVFFMQSYIFVAIWLVFGIYFLLKLAEKFGLLIYKSVIFLTALLFLIPLYQNFYENNKRHFYLAYDYGKNILLTLDKKAVLFASGDNELSILAYLTKVENERPDVRIFDAIGGVIFEKWGGDNYWQKSEEEKRKIFENLKQKIIFNPKLKVYSTLDTDVLNIEKLLFRPEGLLYRIVQEEKELYEGKNWWTQYNYRGLEDVSVYKDFLSREIASTYYYFAGEYLYAIGQGKKAISAFEKAVTVAYHNERMQFDIGMAFYRKKMYDKAIKQFKKTLIINPRNRAALINLGAVYGNLGDYKKAQDYWKRVLEISPHNALANENLERLKELQ